MKRKKTPDQYYSDATIWRDEINALRHILLSSDVTEEMKWGAPCYTFSGKNVVGLGAFKSYFGLWFHQGVLLADEEKVLINAQEGTTKALRQWRMSSREDIQEKLIAAYIEEAIALARDGKSVPQNRNKPLIIPNELKAALATNGVACEAFDTLRRGLQREYADYISEAKQMATKQRRLDKILPMIISGQGLNDKYR